MITVVLVFLVVYYFCMWYDDSLLDSLMGLYAFFAMLCILPLVYVTVIVNRCLLEIKKR